MGTTSGSSDTTSTQPYIQSGPSVQSAGLAAQAQINAANVAANAATQNTTSAIQALMGEYGTALQYASPAINTGNQAMAQMNYMLGLPAVNPGSAPVAPTAPTLQDAENSLTSSQINSYLQDNLTFGSIPGGYNAGIGQYQANGEAGTEYVGYGSAPGGTWSTSAPAGTPTTNGADYMSTYGQLYGDPNIRADATIGAAQDELTSVLDPRYQTNMQIYNQQNNAWDAQENLYNQYSAKGQATPANISNIVDNLPGFQFAQQQGLNQIQNSASASGMLNSGNLLQSLDQFGQGLSEQYYNNYMGQLAGLAGMGNQASAMAGQGATSVGNTTAGLYSNLGNTQANAALAAGQASASSFLSPVAFQQVQMTPYTTSSQTNSTQSNPMGGLSQGVGLLSSLGGLFSSSSFKDKVNTPSTKEILANVDRMQLDRWTYKDIDVVHLGPYAEEFKELFGVGDGRTINIIDLFGVLLGSVKELSAKVKELQEVKHA